MGEIGKPLRVLQVVTNMDRGGLETMLMNYYRNIDRTRVQFDFLTHRQEKAAYDDEILSLGGKIYHLPRLVPWSSTYRKALDNFFKTHPAYSIVHVHQDCLSAVILKAAKQHGVPTRIAHSHNSNQDKNLKYPIKLFYKRFIPKYATVLMACSHEAGDWMFGGSEYQTLFNAIDAKKYEYNVRVREQIRSLMGIHSGSIVVGNIARFLPQKNHTFLVDIFSKLVKRVPNATLLLVGDGELRPAIEEKVKKLNIADQVIMTGVRADIPDLLQAMDIFVLPSLYEGLPLVMLEAQASGLPCIISDKVPTECIVTNGLVSQVKLADGAAAWAERILLCRGAERFARYGEVKAAGYDIVENAKKLEEFYLEHQHG